MWQPWYKRNYRVHGIRGCRKSSQWTLLSASQTPCRPLSLHMIILVFYGKVCSLLSSCLCLLWQGRVECSSLDSPDGSTQGKTDCSINRPILRAGDKVRKTKYMLYIYNTNSVMASSQNVLKYPCHRALSCISGDNWSTPVGGAVHIWIVFFNWAKRFHHNRKD